MRNFTTRSCTACSTALALLLSAMPVSAAEIPARYDDYDPVGADSLVLTAPAQTAFSVQIIQHSPERENLLLFDNAFEPSDEQTYTYALEPADYTLSVTVSAASDRSAPRTLTYDFTVDNADYAAEPELFDRTEIRAEITVTAAGESDSAEPVLSAEPKAFADGIMTQNLSMQFAQYGGITGDFDGNGVIELKDAMAVLKLSAIAAYEDIDGLVTPQQQTLCDINNDGKLDLKDARAILRYYDDDLNMRSPHW